MIALYEKFLSWKLFQKMTGKKKEVPLYCDTSVYSLDRSNCGKYKQLFGLMYAIAINHLRNLSDIIIFAVSALRHAVSSHCRREIMQ